MSARRRVGRRIAAAVVLVVIAALVAVYWWQRPMILTGTGYAAHNACALGQVADRENPETDLPPNPLVPFLRASGEGDPTSATIMHVLGKQKAWFTEGFGCTLADERPDLGAATPIDSAGNPFSADHADAVGESADPALETALDAAFGIGLDAVDRDALGTRGVVVVHDGEIVAERYADGFDATTPQLGWSMSKSVANLMVGALVQQGEVALDDDHLRPEWEGDDRASITVEDLLRMQSGIEWDETYDLGTPITRMLYLEKDMGAYVASLPLDHEPGTVREYSTGSTTLLCAVLAERTGLGADLPRRTILEPLGLSSAVVEADAVGTPVCASYMWATPRDWAAVGQFALQDGVWNGERLIPEGWIADSLTVTDVDESDDLGFGMSWRVNTLENGELRWPGLPDDTFYATGHDGQKVIVIPSEDLVVVRMGFTPGGEEEPTTVALTEAALAAL